jgi:opacity protein-like surface antigen
VKVLGFAALAACAVALPASAQDVSGLWNPHTYLDNSYVEATGGSTFQGATTEYNSGPGGSNEGSGHFRPGYFGSLTFGKRVAPGLALEVEGVYLNNSYDHATLATQGVTGNTRTYGGLANAVVSLPFDYHVTQRFALKPYIGAGVGYGNTNYNTTAPFSDSQSGVLWQVKTGVEIKTGTPVSFDLGYRYIGSPDYSSNFNGANGDSSFRMRDHTQVATAGIKYSF